jgi:hypothetical protein
MKFITILKSTSSCINSKKYINLIYFMALMSFVQSSFIDWIRSKAVFPFLFKNDGPWGSFSIKILAQEGPSFEFPEQQW